MTQSKINDMWTVVMLIFGVALIFAIAWHPPIAWALAATILAVPVLSTVSMLVRGRRKKDADQA